MAARKTPAPSPDEGTPEAAPEVASLVHERGGWGVGYVGMRTDPEPDDRYSVTGGGSPVEPDDE